MEETTTVPVTIVEKTQEQLVRTVPIQYKREPYRKQKKVVKKKTINSEKEKEATIEEESDDASSKWLLGGGIALAATALYLNAGELKKKVDHYSSKQSVPVSTPAPTPPISREVSTPAITFF